MAVIDGSVRSFVCSSGRPDGGEFSALPWHSSSEPSQHSSKGTFQLAMELYLCIGKVHQSSLKDWLHSTVKPLNSLMPLAILLATYP